MKTPPRILVVDDTPANVHILQARLSANGYDIVTATDGEEALAAVRESEPDLILLDVMMPKMDGFEVCRRLRADASLPFIPIIMVTAKTDPKDVVAGLEAGGDEYVTKPVDQVALVSLGERVEPVRVQPARVLRHGVPDALALACLTGRAGPLVTQPGDTLALEYELPASAGEAPELFLQSRGYYLEWMREGWIAEENAERLARLFLAPSVALREMAPAYKRLEPEMESAFWGSRYAR